MLELYQIAERDSVEVSFYAILDRTEERNDINTLVWNFPVYVFTTGDLSFYATVVVKEGMDKYHCHWYKLKISEWQ